MPHKRAKRSVREQDRKAKGADLAPISGSSDFDLIPKGVSRVLNAESIRSEWHERKRKREEEGETGESGTTKKRKTKAKGGSQLSSKPKIKEGESLAEFNRRVEIESKPKKKAAVHGTNSKGKPTSKELAAYASEKPVSSSPTTTGRKTEFDALPKTTRLNDVAQAPPSLTKLPRQAAKFAVGRKAAPMPISMSMQKALQDERAKVVQIYRALKDGRRKTEAASAG